MKDGVEYGLELAELEADSCLNTGNPSFGVTVFAMTCSGKALPIEGKVSRIFTITSGKNRDSPPRRVEISVSNWLRYSCGPGSNFLDSMGTHDMTSMSVQATSKIFSIYTAVRREDVLVGDGARTRPIPCTSIDCFENCPVTATRSLAISIGNLKVMDVSGDVEDRKPFAIESCHTMVRSHCCEVRKSAAWLSVVLRNAGKASVSCRWRWASVRGEQSVLDLFHRPMKVSSKGRYRLTRWMKPAMEWDGSCSTVGSPIVA